MGGHRRDIPYKFDLSQLKDLRSIQVDTWPRRHGHREDLHRHLVVMKIFSTITSPVFSELAVVLKGRVVTCLPQEI